MKKIISLAVVALLACSTFVGCTTDNGSTDAEGSFDTSQSITVISREEGSGTRGAFVEITGVLTEDADGNEVDNTSKGAITTNSTNGVMTQVAGDETAIGYISLGSLNDTVKAVKVGGVEATAENVANETYKVARPFNIAVKKDTELSDAAQDVMNYILSEEGQKIVSAEGYIEVDNNGAFESNNSEGTVSIGGSTSVAPVMEKIKEAYEAINPNVTIEIQATGSSAGMTAAIDGTVDIGMASRELKDTELESLENTVMAQDGIAVIVNSNNSTEDLTIEQIASIFTGETATWADIK